MKPAFKGESGWKNADVVLSGGLQVLAKSVMVKAEWSQKWGG